MMIVAVTLLSVITVLLCLLAWGLIRIASKNRGTVIIDSKTVAILFQQIFHIEYHPSGELAAPPPDGGAHHPRPLAIESSDDEPIQEENPDERGDKRPG